LPILRLKTTLLAGLLAASALASGLPPKLLIELSDDELLRRAPVLAGVSFDHDPALARSVLDPALESVNRTFDKFADLSAAERIFELRLENGGAGARSQSEQFRYVAAMGQGLEVHEFRISETDNKVAESGGGVFLTGNRFFALMETMLPEFEPRLRIRAIGRLGDTVVFAFAQIPGGTLDSGIATRASEGSEPVQGLVWVDAKNGRLSRLRCEPMHSQEDVTLDDLTIDMTLSEVRFETLDATLLLPVRAVVDASRGDVRMHAVHLFADFRLQGRGNGAGVYAPVAAERDALELLGEGAAAVDANNAAGAIAPLREALRLDPALAAAHYHLARALNAAGDAGAAEVEARTALSAMGGVPAAHNLLGVLLMERGAAADAVAEIRETARLTPGDAAAHANLSMALEATGDRPGALAELRRALELAPGNAVLKARLERMSAAPPRKEATEPEMTIRVDVRQVLIPVVVLDKSGHNVSDLKQSDFQVLEDDVEQTITSFRVETSGEPAEAMEAKPGEAKAAAPAPAGPKAAAPAPIRHSYLIVIDSLHAEFGNLHAVRESLRKFFASEPPGDSQYGVVALGQSISIVQNMTRDPSEALAALDDKAFSKTIAGSRGSVVRRNMQDYIRRLDQIRGMIDSGDPGTREMGLSQMKQLPLETEQIAGMDRIDTISLLSGLRELVRQMAAGTGHRTLLLISDGFQLSPGRDAWELLNAYFPGLAGMRGLDRMQSEFDGVVRIAARSNVVISTIDSRGLFTPSFADAGNLGAANASNRVIPAMNRLQTEAGFVLADFAAATGGTAFQSSNDILGGIRKAVAEGRNYYTLGYVPSNAAVDGKFRKVAVQVKRRNVNWRAKRGYWATAN
jgi:VWFA-related protein